MTSTRRTLDQMVQQQLDLYRDRATKIWIVRDCLTGQTVAHHSSRQAALRAMPDTLARHAATRISRNDYTGLRSRRVDSVHHNAATLTVTGTGADRRFLMSGPSGEHSLLLDATDHARLQAHWQVFARDSRNA